MVYIVGCEHHYQRKIKQCFGGPDIEAFERRHKDYFYRFLEAQIREHGICFVGEEIGQGEETLPGDLAQLGGCGYANIDMPLEERERRGIPHNYSVDGAPYSAADIDAWHRIREIWMVRRTLERAGECQSILVVCGRCHQNRLADLFREEGCAAQVIDLASFPWYSQDWMADFLRSAS